MLHKPLLRLIARRNVIYNSSRNGGHHSVAYRTANAPPSRATKIGAEVSATLMWWWILWHLWHEPGHIIGEFPYPDSSTWTNSELGIPKE